MSESSTQAAEAKSQKTGLLQLTAVVAILGVTVLVTALTADVTKASEPGVRLVNGKPALPDQVGKWAGGAAEGLTEDEIKMLPEDTTGVRRRYVNEEGEEVICSVIVAGRDVTSIHRPEVCLPGQGWAIGREQVVPVPVSAAPGGTLKVMRMDATHAMSTSGTERMVRMMFIYWFVGKDRLTPYHWQRILWTTKDRVLHNKNHRWAYLLIASPVRPSETQAALDRAEAATQAVLTQFVKDLYPSLQPGQEK